MSETKEPCEVEQIERKNAMKKNKVANTPLRKRNKKEPIRVVLRLKRDERLDKMKELEKGHDTPVGWISKEKNMILANEMIGRREQCHNASGTKEKKVEMTTGGDRCAGMQNGQRGKCSDA